MISCTTTIGVIITLEFWILQPTSAKPLLMILTITVPISPLLWNQQQGLIDHFHKVCCRMKIMVSCLFRVMVHNIIIDYIDGSTGIVTEGLKECQWMERTGQLLLV